MSQDASHPPPKTLVDTLREIPVGASELIVGPSKVTVRSTLTRIKRGAPDRNYTTRPDGAGVRVWRLA